MDKPAEIQQWEDDGGSPAREEFDNRVEYGGGLGGGKSWAPKMWFDEAASIPAPRWTALPFGDEEATLRGDRLRRKLKKARAKLRAMSSDLLTAELQRQRYRATSNELSEALTVCEAQRQKLKEQLERTEPFIAELTAINDRSVARIAELEEHCEALKSRGVVSAVTPDMKARQLRWLTSEMRTPAVPYTFTPLKGAYEGCVGRFNMHYDQKSPAQPAMYGPDVFEDTPGRWFPVKQGAFNAEAFRRARPFHPKNAVEVVDYIVNILGHDNPITNWIIYQYIHEFDVGAPGDGARVRRAMRVHGFVRTQASPGAPVVWKPSVKTTPEERVRDFIFRH